jgi:hypothetical protein
MLAVSNISDVASHAGSDVIRPLSPFCAHAHYEYPNRLTETGNGHAATNVGTWDVWACYVPA